ncbi:hypothetical protein CLTEP_02830 [Clostridium tepidiprofundi DSM 19306]|uniref:Uncharacterized protein n=1 Tax=Clostridium tepidiprofundi DSM 19306 TaxID=1121338 RepID=A0A151B7X2_9CLOT|nr:hypothetical protein CLTEP_02830 [Clostridium tepidiprofundi DSM 19306]
MNRKQSRIATKVFAYLTLAVFILGTLLSVFAR